MRADLPDPGLFPELALTSIDNEHRALAKFLAKLHQAILDRRTLSEQRLLLHEFISYFRVHCSHEDQLMGGDDFVDRKPHAVEHQTIDQRLEWLDEILVRSAPAAALEALRDIAGDLYAHVNWWDRRFVEWHQKRSPQSEFPTKSPAS